MVKTDGTNIRKDRQTDVQDARIKHSCGMLNNEENKAQLMFGEREEKKCGKLMVFFLELSFCFH